MSFTQENKTNVLHCDGCEKRCKFGIKIEEDRFFPTIGGTKIDFFQDENDNTKVTGRSGYDLWRAKSPNSVTTIRHDNSYRPCGGVFVSKTMSGICRIKC